MSDQPARRDGGEDRSDGGPDGGPRIVGSVYVHAPFCARRCSYCDFAVTVDRAPEAGAWIRALDAELRWLEGEGRLRLADELASLYVGGGTPSLLGPDAMAALADTVGPERLRHPRLEWTAEANPESFTREVAEGWAAAGVNRLSLGAQTFHEAALRWMGRLHGPDGPERAVAHARAASIENVSVDLIFGLPASLGRDWSADLERLLALDVPHVSLYGLSVERETPLGRAVAAGREPPVDEERYAEEFLLAAELLARAGYEQYEVSNFARPGARARHNAVYWAGQPYLGLGNGAHSYAHPVRRWNERAWERYRERVATGASPLAGQETLDDAAARLERVWLDLRTSEGVRSPAPGTRAAAVTDRWIREGLAIVVDERVRLTPPGWLVLDEVAVELDEASDAA